MQGSDNGDIKVSLLLNSNRKTTLFIGVSMSFSRCKAALSIID